jgi:hypothetical protein
MQVDEHPLFLPLGGNVVLPCPALLPEHGSGAMRPGLLPLVTLYDSLEQNLYD